MVSSGWRTNLFIEQLASTSACRQSHPKYVSNASNQQRSYRVGNVIRVPQRHLTCYYEKNVDVSARADKDIGIVVAAKSSTIGVYILSLQLLLQFHTSQLSHKTIASKPHMNAGRKRSRSETFDDSHPRSLSEMPETTPFRIPSNYRYDVPRLNFVTGTRESIKEEEPEASIFVDGVHLVPPPGNPKPCYRYKQPALANLSSSSSLPRQLENHLLLYYQRLNTDADGDSADDSKCFSMIEQKELKMHALERGSGVIPADAQQIVTIFASGTIRDL